MAASTIRGGKQIYQLDTLVGNWCEDRWDKKYQQRSLYKKCYELPTRSAKNWGRTSDAYGSTFAEEVTKKLSGTVREIDVLKYAMLPPKEMYTSAMQREFTDPVTRPNVSHEPNAKFTDEFLTSYRSTWTNGEPHLYQRKEL